MKLRMIFAAGLLLAALISCQCLRKQSAAAGGSRVQIDQHAILIPGTAIAAADREAVNKIFRKYDSSLYRIAVYESGTLKKEIGTMNEMQIGEIAQEYSRNAQANGLTNWTNKIGNITHVTNSNQGNITHVTAINHVGNPTHVTAANQVGNPTHVTSVNQGGSPTHVTSVNQNGRPTHTTAVDKESDALVQEVTPILEKYSK